MASAVQCGPAITAEGFGAASQVAIQLDRAVFPARMYWLAQPGGELAGSAAAWSACRKLYLGALLTCSQYMHTGIDLSAQRMSVVRAASSRGGKAAGAALPTRD